MLPTGEEAVSAYERDGGNLRSPEVFGTDILAGNEQLQQLRFDNFNAAYPSFEVIYIQSKLTVRTTTVFNDFGISLFIVMQLNNYYIC